MHIYFSGIGGAGIGPLAQIAHEAGYQVSGSDKQDSAYISYLRKHGVSAIHVGQSREAIAAVHNAQPIDWFVYTSALPLENPHHPELIYCRENGIRVSKRDEFLNQILSDKELSLIAAAGTHGKTTTTALLTWLFVQLNQPVSYLLPAKTSFAELGHYDNASNYFVYEADEFDRNFLAYQPKISVITGVSWDHHELFPTREDYQAAFQEFIGQSEHTFIWDEDAAYLGVGDASATCTILDAGDERIEELGLLGKYNRLDAWLAVQAVHCATGAPIHDLIEHVRRFPGLSRRMELIAPGIYSDYAHTPEKIRGAMSVALEMAAENGQEVVVVYEPLTDRRQHYIIDDYKDCFAGAKHVYWLPSYLAREDSETPILTPVELIAHLADPSIASAAARDDTLKKTIQELVQKGVIVVGMAGGGGGSLDDWLRAEFAA